MAAWESIADIAYNAVVAFDVDDRILAWNTHAEELFGLPRAEALGRGFAETVLPEGSRAEHLAEVARFHETGGSPLLDTRLRLTVLARDGDEIPVEMTITAAAGRSAYAFYAVIADRSELRASERFAITLDALAEAVTIRGEGDRLLYANRAALQRMRIDSIEQLREADPHGLLEPYVITTADGREVGVEDLPSARLLRGEDPEPLLMRTVNRASGEEHWTLLKATPMRAPDGSVESAVTIIEDVTAEHRAAIRMEFLARAGELLVSSLDYEQTLRNVAGLAVPQLADWCAVDLFDEQHRRVPVAVAHSDPRKIELAELLRAREPEQLDPEGGLGRVLRTGEPELYTEITDDMLVQAAIDEEHLRLLREVGMRAAIIVPMRVHGRPIGTLTLVNSDSGRSFDTEDVAFAQQIAARAALAVENARLYRQRSDLVRTLQQSLLPDALPEIPGWEVAALYRPAGEDSEVGGDFYDVWRVGEDWLVLIGDVTGKGVGAATLTSLARHSAVTASEFDPRPSRVLARIDTALRRRPSISLCTALCMRIRASRVEIASAGHPLPLHVAAGEVRELGHHGILLGAYDGVTRPEDTVVMRPGESLVAITDGVTDAIGAGGERFGAARVQERLQAVREEPPLLIMQGLMASVESFQTGVQADDTAVLIARFSGQGAGSEAGLQAGSLSAAGAER